MDIGENQIHTHKSFVINILREHRIDSKVRN